MARNCKNLKFRDCFMRLIRKGQLTKGFSDLADSSFKRIIKFKLKNFMYRFFIQNLCLN